MFLRNVDKHLPDYTTSYIYTFIFAAMKTSTSHGTNNSIQCVERFLGRQSPKAELDQEMVSDIYIYIYISEMPGSSTGQSPATMVEVFHHV
jgi:hypothetical protein